MSFFEAVRRVLSGRAAPGNRTPAAERPAASAAATEPIRSTDTHPSGYPAEVGGPAPDDAVARRQERAAERLLEDERLRGSMTDDEFKPLLEWALATVDRVAAATAGEPDAVADERIERALATIRRVIGAVDRALALAAQPTGAELRDALRSLAEAATSLLASDGEVASRRARITAELERVVRDEPGLRGAIDDQGGRAALATRLARVLSEGPRPEHEVLG